MLFQGFFERMSITFHVLHLLVMRHSLIEFYWLIEVCEHQWAHINQSVSRLRLGFRKLQLWLTLCLLKALLAFGNLHILGIMLLSTRFGLVEVMEVALRIEQRFWCLWMVWYHALLLISCFQLLQ
jgi:hypothetical protein